MKPLQTSLLLALGAALAAPAPAADATGSGLLGRRYVEASAFITDYNDSATNSYAVGTAVNIPLTAHFDAGASFQHTWLEGDEGENFQDFAAYLAAYTTCGDFRPFARASLAYEWWHVSDDPFYQIDLGSEYLVTKRLSLSAQLSWSEFLATDWNGGSFSASGRANYWLTDTLAASAMLGCGEGGNWSYGIGTVFEF